MSCLDELDVYVPLAVIEMVTSLEDEIERLRADAERYRWLKANIPIILSDVPGNIEIEKLDAAIDAAMKEERK